MSRLSSLLFIMLLGACSLPAQGGLPAPLATMTNELANKKAILIDVREQGEWDEGHLSLARLAPLSALRQGVLPQGFTTDKSTKIYLHCRSGNRVKAAAPILRDLGYTNLVPLSEGYSILSGYGLK